MRFAARGSDPRTGSTKLAAWAGEYMLLLPSAFCLSACLSASLSLLATSLPSWAGRSTDRRRRMIRPISLPNLTVSLPRPIYYRLLLRIILAPLLGTKRQIRNDNVSRHIKSRQCALWQEAAVPGTCAGCGSAGFRAQMCMSEILGWTGVWAGDINKYTTAFLWGVFWGVLPIC